MNIGEIFVSACFGIFLGSANAWADDELPMVFIIQKK